MSFPRHGGEFRLNFGLGEMLSISNFARNFAQRKNAQHSKFRNEFRETPALPKRVPGRCNGGRGRVARSGVYIFGFRARLWRADFYRFMLILPVWALLPFYAKTRSRLVAHGRESKP